VSYEFFITEMLTDAELLARIDAKILTVAEQSAAAQMGSSHPSTT